MNTDFRLFPDQASTMAPRVDALFWFILAVCALARTRNAKLPPPRMQPARLGSEN